MNEFIYAEFLFSRDDTAKGMAMLSQLGSDFIELKSTVNYDLENYSTTDTSCVRVEGQLNSVAATAITLGNTFLSERMHTSHIPSSLKDMYRKR